MPEVERQWRYELSKCMTCGVCLQACPNVNDRSNFMGPFIIGQVDLFNSHPTGEMNKEERTGRPHRRRRVAGMRKLPELCPSLSQRCAPDHGHCPDEPGGHQAHVPQVAFPLVLDSMENTLRNCVGGCFVLPGFSVKQSGGEDVFQGVDQIG